MNLTTLTTSLNGPLLLLGLFILIVGGLARAVWLRRGHLHAGVISVIVVLLACALVTFGLVRIAFPALSGGVPVAAADPTGSVAPSLPTATALAGQGSTIDVSSSTPANVGSGKPASPGPQSSSPIASLISGNRFFPLLAVIGAGLTFVMGLLMVLYERRQQGFNPSSSPGLLYTGAGVFVLVAAVVVPNLPAQFAAKPAPASVAVVSTTGALPTRVVPHTPTVTVTPLPSLTSTAMPSLTPAQASSPTALFTPIAYAFGADTSGSKSTCSVTAQTTLNLRGDPSVQQQAIGRVFAGSLLPVTAQSPDGKWWRVISTDGGTAVEGWVSADWVTPGSGCTVGAVPFVGPTLPPTRTSIPGDTPAPTIPSSRTPVPTNTPQPTRTQLPTTTPQPSATPTITASPTPVSVGPACVVMTTSKTSLRADPSNLHAPIADVPPATALVADLSSADTAWWHVTFVTPGGKLTGWVSAQSAFAAAACLTLPTAVLSPVP